MALTAHVNSTDLRTVLFIRMFRVLITILKYKCELVLNDGRNGVLLWPLSLL